MKNSLCIHSSHNVSIPVYRFVRPAKNRRNTDGLSRFFNTAGRKFRRQDVRGALLNRLIEKLCKRLYEYDGQVFRSLTRHSNFKGRKLRIIDDNNSDMRRPLKIAEGLYSETNRSANDILNCCKLIIEKFDSMEESSSYKLKSI